MGILDEDVARVREATDLVALIGEQVALRRSGRRFVGLCPFHTEKTPSFSVNPEMGVFHCFGCGKSGDAITWVRETEHLDFVEAVERLAAGANIPLRYDDVTVSKDRQQRQRLVDVVAAAVDFYHQVLLEAPEGGPARRYLRGRGFEGDVARRFMIGFATDDWDRLSVTLQQAKHARDDLVAAGLSFVNRANRLQDAFRGRLMFPIYDQRGDPVGFGGRTLGGEGPKYKNTAETPIYHKSRLLYGLNWAKADVVARGEMVLCEGYTDVIAFHLAGATQAVATCGTALADEHFQVIKNLARRVVLAYDADAAGQAAAERAYHWEQRFDVEFRVADLPAGRDPADVWRDDPAKLLEALERAKPFLQFRLDRVLGGADLGTAEGRARSAAAVVPVLAEHPNELVREGYIQQVAGTLGFDHSWFKDAIARRVRGTAEPAEPAESARARSPGDMVDPRELEALRLALHEPQLVVDLVSGALFENPLARRTYDALAHFATPQEALAGSEPDVRALLERLAVEEPETGDDAAVYAVEVVTNLVDAAAMRRVHALARAGDERSSQVKQLVDRLVRARDAGDWLDVRAAVEQLLPWVEIGADE